MQEKYSLIIHTFFVGPTLGSNTGFGLGGSNFLSSTTTSAASITGSISSSQVASKGLGGVDPKVSAGISGEFQFYKICKDVFFILKIKILVK